MSRSRSVLLLALTAPALAAEPLYSGYAIIQRAEVTANDLHQVVYRQVSAPTVHDGLHEILAGTGYRLAGPAANDPELFRLLEQPYPEHKRRIGPAGLTEVLAMVAGPAWVLVVDPVNRLLGFERSGRYRHD